jgi:hypothetical protein
MRKTRAPAPDCARALWPLDLKSQIAALEVLGYLDPDLRGEAR